MKAGWKAGIYIGAVILVLILLVKKMTQSLMDAAPHVKAFTRDVADSTGETLRGYSSVSFADNTTAASRRATAINSISPYRSASQLLRLTDMFARNVSPREIAQEANVHIAAVETVRAEVD